MKTVMVFGTFDIVHPGHLFLFTEAKKHAKKLIVCVARDTTSNTVKGKNPFYNEKQRKAFLEHIDIVDEVILGDKKDPYKIIKKIKPNVIALGFDQVAFVDGLTKELEKAALKTKVVRIPKYRSQHIHSHILKSYIEQTV